ncbi:Down syndrome cell adhesion molecule-like protein Dscam2 [Nymphon striatum]|nr:Down syndrome cell adhesion molecule-like protein Dscam2 [Nymphon striatum]
MNNTRAHFYRGSKKPPPLKKLPPTDENLQLHVLRAHLQMLLWKAADQRDPPIEARNIVARNIEGSTITPVVSTASVAPQALLDVVSCSCTSEGKACSGSRCSCSSAGLSCTDYCKCEGGDTCCSPLTSKHMDIEEEQDVDNCVIDIVYWKLFRRSCHEFDNNSHYQTVSFVLLPCPTKKNLDLINEVAQKLEVDMLALLNVIASVHVSLTRISSSQIAFTIHDIFKVVMQLYETQVYDEFVISGNVAVLKCHIPSYVRDHVIVIAWIREDKSVIKMNDKLGDLYIVQPSGNLYIRRATKDHQQLRYWCQTKHLLTGETKMSSTSGRVVVSEPEGTVPPRITDREAVIEAKEGEQVKIHCAGQGRPPPLYSWFYKDENGKITQISTSNVMLDKEILLIERTKKEHSGTYLCVVSNNAGKQQTETTIIIKSPLTVYITPQTTVADADSSANFTCSVSGGPAKVISWLKNGYPLNLNEPNIEVSEDQKTLSIEKVSKESEAMYQCMAENSQDSGQGSAQLVLGASKPVVATGFSKIVLKNGMNLRLQCEVYGKPIPDIRWFLDGQRIVQNHRISIKLKQAQNGNLLGELSTDSITAENSGDYSCLTTNEAGSASHSARIDVYGVPSIRAFRNLTVISGSIIKVKCYVLDGDIPLLSDRYDVTDRILTINKVDKVSDTGRFTCTVNNRKGQTATQHLWINVLEKPLLDDMMDKDVEQEISLKLMCSAIKGDSPIAFTWKFNSQPLPDNRGLMVTKHSDVSLLMIPSVQIVHQGNYTCIASNEAGSANKTAKVTVRSPPSWNKIPKNTKLTSKGRVRLDCEARGNPPPYIAWYIIYGSKEKILLNNSTRQTVLQNGSLILWNVEEKDYIHDKFECVVNNGLGKLSNTFKLKRGVEVKVSVDNEEIISHLGDSIQMNCRITGSEPLSVKWTVNYQVIKPSSKYILSHQKNKEELISKLSIDNYMERDSGEYKCLASNTLGKQFKTITLATVDVLFQNDVGPEHVTLKKDEDNLLDLVIPMTAVCGVALLVVLLTLVCIKVRNSRRSTSTPIYG